MNKIKQYIVVAVMLNAGLIHSEEFEMPPLSSESIPTVSGTPYGTIFGSKKSDGSVDSLTAGTNTTYETNPTINNEKVVPILSNVPAENNVNVPPKPINPYEQNRNAIRKISYTKQCRACVDDTYQLLKSVVQSNNSVEGFAQLLQDADNVLDKEVLKDCSKHISSANLLKDVAHRFEKEGNVRAADVARTYAYKYENECNNDDDVQSLVQEMQNKAIEKMNERIARVYQTLYPNQPVSSHPDIANYILHNEVILQSLDRTTNTLIKQPCILINDITFIVNTFFKGDIQEFYKRLEGYAFSKGEGYNHIIATWAVQEQYRLAIQQQHTVRLEELKKKANEWYPQQIGMGALGGGITVGVIATLLKYFR